MSERRFRSVELSITPAGSRSLVREPRTGRSALMSGVAVLLLRSCRRFQTLKAHAASRASPRRVLPILRQLRDEGWLESPEDILADLALAADIAAPPIASVAVITRDSPMMLGRCLQSTAASLEAYGHSAALAVFDDSEGAAAASTARQAARFNATLFDRASRRALRRRLVEAGAPVLPVRFALEGSPGLVRGAGVSRNAALLTLGGANLLLDDAVFCQGVHTDGGPARLDTAPDPCAVRWYPSRADALSEATPLDLIRAHQQALGREVGALLPPDAASAAWWDRVPPSMTAALRGGGCRVAATTLGALGDSDAGDTHWQLHLRGDAAALARERWDEVRLCRDVRRAPDAVVLSGASTFPTLAIGLDSRQLLPPFLPSGHDAGELFGLTLRRADPESLIAALPVAIAHDPPEHRRETEAALREGLARLTITDLVGWAMSEARPRGDASSRLAGLGESLMAVGRWPLSDLSEWLHERWRRRLALGCGALEALAADVEGTASWFADAEAAREALLVRAMGEPPRVVELSPGLEGDAALAAVRAHLVAFGELLIAWPEIVGVGRGLV